MSETSETYDRIARLMVGPCNYCRRAMDWLDADEGCWMICRYCLRYIADVLRGGGDYGQLLIDLASATAPADRPRQEGLL